MYLICWPVGGLLSITHTPVHSQDTLAAVRHAALRLHLRQVSRFSSEGEVVADTPHHVSKLERIDFGACARRTPKSLNQGNQELIG